MSHPTNLGMLVRPWNFSPLLNHGVFGVHRNPTTGPSKSYWHKSADFGWQLQNTVLTLNSYIFSRTSTITLFPFSVTVTHWQSNDWLEHYHWSEAARGCHTNTTESFKLAQLIVNHTQWNTNHTRGCPTYRLNRLNLTSR